MNEQRLLLSWLTTSWCSAGATRVDRHRAVPEEDVALSSISQNEIGHARAIYELLAEDADALAFDPAPEEYECAQLVELRLVPDWARTIARRVLYEAADELRLAQLKGSADADIAGLAAKIDREEAYHRMHAEMWAERLADEPRYREAAEELSPYALGWSFEALGRRSPSVSQSLGSYDSPQAIEHGAPHGRVAGNLGGDDDGGAFVPGAA